MMKLCVVINLIYGLCTGEVQNSLLYVFSCNLTQLDKRKGNTKALKYFLQH